MMVRERDWVLTAKNLLFPIFCKWCGVRLLTEENGYFCPTCWESAGRVTPPYCTVCGQPHAGRLGFELTANFPCAECRQAKTPPYGRIYGALYYEDAIAEAVKLLKFHGKKRLAPALAEDMAEFAAREFDTSTYDWLVPVPLHRVRRRERGFNQAELIAEAVAPGLNGPAVTACLERIRPTRVQSRMHSETERRRNMAGAFALRAGECVEGRRILVVDDVVTTAETVAECARVLAAAGAGRVDVFCAALAIRGRFGATRQPRSPGRS